MVWPRPQLECTYENEGDTGVVRRRAGLLEGPSCAQPLPSVMPVEGDGGGGAQDAMSLIEETALKGVTSGQWWEIRRKKILVEMGERGLSSQAPEWSEG